MLGCFVQRDRLASESFNRSIEKKNNRACLGPLGYWLSAGAVSLVALSSAPELRVDPRRKVHVRGGVLVSLDSALDASVGVA
jgi:hypothetical protein